MQFKLDYTIETNFEISIRNPILSIGSCFADEIGKFLQHDGFDISINPHGIVFNPISIAQIVEGYLENTTHQLIAVHNNRFVSLLHHGSFSSNKQDKLITMLDEAQSFGVRALHDANTLFITWGSAWVYEWNETNQVVANCHKLPAERFTKRLLSIDEIVNAYLPIVELLLNAKKKVVFTISPVRYVRDGLHENNLSKSVLMLALHQLMCKISNLHYFPAYEIVNDELRDYRFFKQDMVHPNEMGIGYVYEKLEQYCFDEETKNIVKSVRHFKQMMSHRIIHENTEQAAEFENKRSNLKTDLLARFPFVKL